jgi:hypothetical protein
MYNEAWALISRRYLKKSSTESRSDLNFEGLRPRTYGRIYSSLGKNGPVKPSKFRSPVLTSIDIVLREQPMPHFLLDLQIYNARH